MVAESRRQDLRVQQDAIELDETDADRVDAVGTDQQFVAGGFDQQVVEPAVDGLALGQDLQRGILLGPVHNVDVQGPLARQLVVRHPAHGGDHGLALIGGAHLEGVADHRQIDRRDLDAALGQDRQQPLGFQPGQELTQGADRNTQDAHHLALRDQLAGAQSATEQRLLKALIGRLFDGRAGRWSGRCRGACHEVRPPPRPAQGPQR